MTSTLPIRLPLDGNTASGSRSSQLPQFEGSAHAKAILFGEHAVVYGAPAIAVPIHELAAEARVDSAAEGVRIESELFSGDASAAPAHLQPVVTAIHAALAYCGKSDALPEAFGLFAARYAEQNEKDHDRLASAIRSGRVQARLNL